MHTPIYPHMQSCTHPYINTGTPRVLVMDQGFAILDSLEDDLPGLDTGILGQVHFFPPQDSLVFTVSS